MGVVTCEKTYVWFWEFMGTFFFFFFFLFWLLLLLVYIFWEYVVSLFRANSDNRR